MRLLITVVMLTMPEREPFARRAVRQIMAQHPGRKGGLHVDVVLVISEQDPDPKLGIPCRVLKVPNSMSLGQRRNLGLLEARGEFVAFWDDDDWSGPRRLMCSIEPVILDRADITVLRGDWCATMDGKFWTFGGAGDFADGTVAGRRETLARFPFADVSLGENFPMIKAAVGERFRFQVVDAGQQFCIVRHGRNTWEIRRRDLLVPRTVPHGPIREAGAWPVN